MQRDYIKYPLKFKPVFKQTIWGGKKIASFMGTDDAMGKFQEDNVGECWGVSAVSGHESEVVNGELKGALLPDIVSLYGAKLLGNRNVERFGNTFPLLVKFIDAAKDLSVQVHPNDIMAGQLHNCSGKTEMWYVIDSESDAELLSGFANDMSKEEFAKMDGSEILDSLSRFKIKKGDLFYLPAGTVHSIGAGAFIAEIQQSSDITYRIYDFDRVDGSGNKRELHTGQALEAIDFTIKGDNCKILYKERCGESNDIWESAFEVVSGKYFSTSVVKLHSNGIPARRYTLNYAHLDSFVIITCVGGGAALQYGTGGQMEIHCGDVVLLPADLEEVCFELAQGAKFEFLETHI